MSTKKKAAKKATESKPKPVAKKETLLACVVTKEDTRIGAMWCKKGVTARLPESKAKALEKLGQVRIVGVA